MVETKTMPEFDELPSIEEKRGRIKKEKPVKKISPVLLFDNTMLLPFVRFIPNRLAIIYNDDRFSLSKEEENALVDGLNKVSSKWLPTWFERFSDEIALITYVIMISIPRFELARSISTEKKKENNE